jgi:hypothetical protein
LEKVRLNWHITINEVDNTIRRYCHNCGKTATFKDSGIRRHNANGKNIHVYAIYKCDKDHTWNDKLAKYKADKTGTLLKFNDTEAELPRLSEKVCLADLRQQGTLEVEIRLVTIQGKWRLDRVLAQQLIGVSRSEIVKCINLSIILLDGKRVKSSEFVHEDQVIWLDIILIAVSF